MAKENIRICIYSLLLSIKTILQISYPPLKAKRVYLIHNMAHAANPFALLDDDSEVVDKPLISLFEVEKDKTTLNEAQKEILKKQREKQKAKKEEKKAKKEVAERCFFFKECGGKKEEVWAYCKKCYENKRGECRWCDNKTHLKAVGGVFHEMCGACRADAVKHGLDVSEL